MVNLILKYFLNDWNFIKIILKSNFFFINTFYEKISVRLLDMFLDTFFEIYVLHGDFDPNRYQMSYLRWRVCKLSWAGLSRLMRWRFVDLRWIACKFARGLLSTFFGMRKMILGSWSATVRHLFLTDFGSFTAIIWLFH